MDQQAWKLFLYAAELGSFGKVALLRGSSQPQVSRQIGDLEAKIGARLFVRTGRGVTLTALGHRVAPQIREWLNHTAQLENEIQSSAATPLGRVRLGILPSLATPFTSALYRRLALRYPQIRLSVREGQGAQLETWLEEGGLDLAFMFRHGSAYDRDALALSETQTYLVGPMGDRLTGQAAVGFAALDGLPLVAFCRPSRWRDWLEQEARLQGIKLNVVMEADSLALQTAIVADGGAYALLGAYAIAQGLEAQRLQAAQLESPAFTRHIAMTLPKSGQLTPAVRALMDEARALASELAMRNSVAFAV